MLFFQTIPLKLDEINIKINMPNITYTPQEQAQIDAANKAISDATNALTIASALRDSEWSESPNRPTNPTGYGVLSWLTEVQKCKSSFTVIRDKDGNATVINAPVPNCSVPVAGINKALAAYNTYQNQYLKAQGDLQNAKDNYTTLTTAIASAPDIKTQQNVIQQTAAAAQQLTATVTKSKWFVFAVIVIVVIAFAYFMLKTKSA